MVFHFIEIIFALKEANISYTSTMSSRLNMSFKDLVQTPTLSSLLTVAVITGFATLAFFFWILQQCIRRNKSRLPPGPYPWPIIGNLHQLSLPAYRSLKNLADKYGPSCFCAWALSRLWSFPLPTYGRLVSPCLPMES